MIVVWLSEYAVERAEAVNVQVGYLTVRHVGLLRSPMRARVSPAFQSSQFER